MVKKVLSLALVTLGLFFTSCSNDDDGIATANLTLDINGLEELGADFVYEGWIIVDGAPVSTGTFTSTATGQTFNVDATQLAAAARFVLSIEPAGETGDAAATPADTKLVVGDFAGSTANISIGTVGDFSATPAVAGKFFLRAPTDEPAVTINNDENGIWFGIPGTMPPAPSLMLPTLEAGWKYEGWVIVEGVGPLSTGTFTAFDVRDDNAGDPNSFNGTENAGPPIPGEDFFNNAPDGFTFPLDIRGRTVVISVEPFPDNSPAPFLLKPLSGVAGNDTAPATYDFAFSNGSFPTGSVSR